MATSKQEQIYNEILEYYAFADRLIKAVEDSNHSLSAQQFEIIEDIVIRLEDCADKLAEQYINFVKKSESSEIIDKVRDSLNEISQKVEECRSKILLLSQQQ